MEPLKIKIKDFYAMANGLIDFTDFSSALICGQYEDDPLKSNGSSKSTIFEAISWVVFNKTRQKTMGDVIRWDQNEACVEFEFRFGTNTYKIIRKRSRIADESIVSFFTKQGGVWKNDSASTSTETDKKIVQLLKIDARTFLNSVYFKQLDISLFADSTPGARKDIIKSIMKLEQWDKYQKKADMKMKSSENDIEKYTRIVNDNSNIEVLSEANKKAIVIVNEKLNDLTIKQKETQNSLHSLFELKREKSLDKLQNALNDINNEIEKNKINGKKLQINQAELKNKTEQNKIIEQNIDNKIKSINAAILDFDEQLIILNSKNSSYNELDEIILALKVKKNGLQNVIDEINNTNSMINVGECSVCLTNITDEALPHVRSNRQNKKDITQKSLDDCLNKLHNIEEEYKDRKLCSEKIQSIILKYDAANLELEKTLNVKIGIDNNKLRYEEESNIITNSINSIIDLFRKLKSEAEDLEKTINEQKINSVDIEISLMDVKNNKFLNEMTYLNIELGSLLKEKNLLEDRKTALEGAILKLTNLNKEKASYEQLGRFFGKDGIQAVFIESVVDELEKYANETLSYICNEPTVIKLRTQKKSGEGWKETLDIDILMNNHLQTFESLSGGERFRISLAIRIGLSEVLVKRAGGEINLLLLDEVDSPLDQFGKNNLFEGIIRGLEKRFKVLVISHNEYLKDRFEHLIMVNKTSNGSFIM